MRTYEDQPSGTVDELRCLRREAPEPERRLLRALKEAFPELKWRHQSPLGPCKPDLLCFSKKLVVDVDGDTHADSAKKDARRTAFIERQAYRVIRFTNADVMQNLDGVIAQISLSLGEREGGAQRRKGEDRIGGQPSTCALPHPSATPSDGAGYAGAAARLGESRDCLGNPGPPAPHSASSNMSWAFCAVALSRTVSPSIVATRPAGR